MTTALYGGSFDPIHRGHVSVVETAAARFDEIIVVVLANPQKAGGLFSVDQRVGLVTASIAHLENVSATSYHGLIVEAARDLGAGVLVRSSHKEPSSEQSMAAVNARLSAISTVFVTPRASTAWISSTLVREMHLAGRHEECAALVPGPVARSLRDDFEPS